MIYSRNRKNIKEIKGIQTSHVESVIELSRKKQIVLFPAEAKNSLGVARYNIQELSDDENRNNAINDLKMEMPKLKLISKDDCLLKELDKFIYQKSEE